MGRNNIILGRIMEACAFPAPTRKSHYIQLLSIWTGWNMPAGDSGGKSH